MRNKKEILINAQKRLKEMEFDLAFYINVYNNCPTDRIKNKITLLTSDIEELKNEIKIFIGGV